MSYSSTILAEASLVSYWDLQEAPGAVVAVDSKSALDLATSVGAYTFGGVGPGDSLATSWVSDGTTGYLSRAATATALDITGAMSFDCWAKVNGANASDWGYLMSRNATYAFGTRTSGVLTSELSGTDTDSTVTGAVSGSWAHYGYTVSAGGSVTYYVNGAQIGTPVASSAVAPGIHLIYLGNFGGATFFSNANIAGCAIYNSELSGASILAHYTALVGVAAPRRIGAWSTRSGGY